MEELLEKLRLIQPIEKKIVEIESMNKDGLSFDQQERLINEYNKLWDKLNQ